MQLYIITKTCSGEDYGQDQTEIMSATNDEADALKNFNKLKKEEIKDCGPEDYEVDVDELTEFELTNHDCDYHVVLKLHTEECNCTFTTGLGRSVSF